MTTASKPEIRRAIDRYGARLANWPNRDLARATRAAALADPEVGAWLGEARALGAALDKAAAAIDGEIDRSGAVARVADAVLAAVAHAPEPRTRWIAVAALLLLAAGLGGAVELTMGTPGEQPSVDVVILDPLVFGPAGIDQ